MANKQKLQEKEKRINKAINLETPDRVPIFLYNHFFPAKYAGISNKEAYYNLDKWLSANRKFFEDFNPDMGQRPSMCVFTGGKVNELLDIKQFKWPGHGVGENISFQFVEDEYIKGEEYKQFLHDPSDFILRKYMPRVFGSFSGFSKLPPMRSFMLGGYGTSLLASFADPEVWDSFERLHESAKAAVRWLGGIEKFEKEMTAEGHLFFSGALTLAPFDLISDLFRGLKGSILDMFRYPDEIIAVQDIILPDMINNALQQTQISGNPRVFIPLHRGADCFMSNEQFEKFYWPNLKKLFLELIDNDLTPCPFFEGSYMQRLQYLKELPKGKILGMFDKSDLFKVKEEIGDTMCIAGDMPLSLLRAGSADKIKNYTRKLIDEVGKNGGFIMAANTVLDDADPELLKIWVDYTREYGVY